MHTLTIKYCCNELGIRDLLRHLERTGYKFTVFSNLDNTTQLRLLSKEDEIRFWKKNSIKSTLLAIICMLLYMIVPMMWPTIVQDRIFPYKETSFVRGLFYRDILGVILASYIQFSVGFYFYKAAWASLSTVRNHGYTSLCFHYLCIHIFCVFFSSQYVPFLKYWQTPKDRFRHINHDHFIYFHREIFGNFS